MVRDARMTLRHSRLDSARVWGRFRCRRGKKGTVLGVEEELRIVLHPDLPDALTRVDLVTSNRRIRLATMADRPAWSTTTPLGRPVEPDV